MDNKEDIKQPSVQLQEALDEVLESTPAVYSFRGKNHKMGWLGNMTLRKLTHITLKEKDEHKRNMKLCAILRVNSVFAWFRYIVYSFKWRYYYYVLDLNDVEALRVIDAAKKKLPTLASTLITIFSTAMTDTTMAMTKKEAASATQAEQAGEQPTA